ncbi:uncharacterized protein C8R40DRAFT_1172942 [Lentinula edodes]|uniref:uncharacterized protein n=1 Tax=Lentinula edodes TaxID=5353 RepID=UPI001E8EADBF|nr:uncharacterized protein C8R40DRAFT_1172942 [Lentinula edodes]KAH7872886.1 hypothetical protein C8R40DRAFT_1172942 [Lentinula edodes]
MLTWDSGPVEITPAPSGTHTTTNEINIIISNSTTPSGSSTTKAIATAIGNILSIIGDPLGPGDQSTMKPTRISQSASEGEVSNTIIQFSSVTVNATSTSPPSFAFSSSSPSSSSSSSSSSSPKSGANSHIGVIVSGAVGGGVALAIATTILVLVGIWWKRYQLKEMFLKLEAKPGTLVQTADCAGTGEGVPGAGGEIEIESGMHEEFAAVGTNGGGGSPRRHARFGVATPYLLKYHLGRLAPILSPPRTLTAQQMALEVFVDGGERGGGEEFDNIVVPVATHAAGHGVPTVGSRAGDLDRRYSRNVFIHWDRGSVNINADMPQGEQVPEEVPPTYESLMSSLISGLMPVRVRSRSSEHNRRGRK